MTHITDLTAKEIFDSRSKPTLEVTVLAGNARGTFAVPSGASVGSHEAFVLHDEDGGMDACMRSIEEIKTRIVGSEVENQAAIDLLMKEIDGTDTFSRLGGNVLLGISIAAARAAAEVRGQPLYAYLQELLKTEPHTPLLYMNYLNGGKHAITPIAFQEYIVVPQAETVSQALEIAERFERALQSLIGDEYGLAAAESSGDEGGFVIPEGTIRTPLQLFTKAAQKAGVTDSVRFALDVAASSFYSEGSYLVDGEEKSPMEMHELYVSPLREFPLLSIEDPFNEDAIEDFAQLQKTNSCMLVGDDLTVTNAQRIRLAAEQGAITGVIIKPNQIGTLSDTIAAIHEARAKKVSHIVSHRSGETMDDFIADLAFASEAYALKAGTPRKAERRAKYERLRAITE